ncbi:MAG: EAL domain-containing protein [Burkholderiales bacterium]
MTKASNEGGTITSKLLSALRGGQFVLYGQTIAAVRPERGERPYREILIRFREEEQKMLPPGDFFPILEEQGLIGLLDRWVVSEVLKLSAASDRGRYRNSVNLSSDSIVDPEFAHFVSRMMKQHTAGQDVLSFEVTQSDASANLRHLRQMITALKPAGCSFALSGYTGTTADVDLLGELSVGFLKIDGGLVRKLTVSKDVLALVKSIIDRCRKMGVRTVAELVEDPHTLAELKKLGADYAQGYGIAKPAPVIGEV